MQGERRAEDIAVTKAPDAPVLQSDALRNERIVAAPRPALFGEVRHISQPLAQASAGLKHGLDPPHVFPLAFARKLSVLFQVAAQATTLLLLQKPSQVPSLQPLVPTEDG